MLFLSLLSCVLLGLLAALSSAAPAGHYPLQQQFAAVDNLSRPYLAKRGVEILSPVFSHGSTRLAEKPSPTVHGPALIPRPKYVYGSGNTQKTPWTPPWRPKESPPGPKPKLWNPALGLDAEKLGTGERFREPKSVITDPVMAMLTSSTPVVIGSTAMTASELGRKIVDQIDVECPHCGFGIDPGPSKWARFVEWLRGVWEKVKSGFARKKAEQ